MPLNSQVRPDGKPHSAPAPIHGHIFLVDDNDDIRRYLSDVLRRFGLSVAAYADAESFLLDALEVAPAVILMDMALPGKNGIAAVNQLRDAGFRTPVIYISGQSEPEEIITAMKLGAVDFLWKPFSIDRLVEAIQKAIATDEARISAQTRSLRIRDLWNRLTQREQEICRLIVAGRGNSEISKLLGVMPDTVKKHRAKVMDKMGAISLAHLIELFTDFDFSS